MGSIEEDRPVRRRFLPAVLAAVAVVMFLFAFFYRNEEEGQPGHVIGAVAWYGLWISVALFSLWFIWTALARFRR
jgi:multisubunit Na+/H+ antiporter MnhB subunit